MASKIRPQEPLVLGSGSPRRRELLTRMGIPLTVVRPSGVDEGLRSGEDPDRYLERVVAAKASATAAAVDDPPAILVADTVVLLDGEILVKPADDRESADMIRRLSGRAHTVATRYALSAASGQSHVETVRTQVWFRRLGEAQIERYVASGEGRDKAGAYGIQGIGAMLVERIEGDYANVVGLPICAVIQAMERLELITACPMNP
jgi:septum formation protein